MDSTGPEKPLSPPPDVPRMSTFNPDRQVSVLTDEAGSDNEENMEEPIGADQGKIKPIPDEEPVEVDEPVLDFPPPPPPESLTSEPDEDGATDDVTTPTEESPPTEVVVDEPPEYTPPAEEPQQTQPDVVVDVTDETHDVTGEVFHHDDDAEVAAAEVDLSDGGLGSAGEEPEPVNNVHPLGNFPVYRTSTKNRYVQHEIPEEEKDRKGGLCMCWMVILALLSLGALLVSAIWFVSLGRNYDSDTVDMIEVEGDLISAELRVTLNRTFTDSLYDPSSYQYAELEEDFVKSIELIMSQTRFANNFFGTVVSGFRPGSIVVYSTLYFMPSAKVDKLNKDIRSEIGKYSNTTSLGIREVIVDQVRVTAEEDIKIPIRVFTMRGGTTPRAPPGDMVTYESDRSVTSL